MYDFILMLTSPFALFLMLVVFFLIEFTVGASKLTYSVLNMTSAAASGVSMILIALIAISFFDMSTTCRLLLDNKILQFEFIVIAMYSVSVMFMRYVRNFDKD